MKILSWGLIWSGSILQCVALYEAGRCACQMSDRPVLVMACIVGIVVMWTGWGLAVSKGDAE